MKCSFCGEEIEQGTGSKFIKNDGTVFNFCSSKCRKNKLALKRNPAHLKWTEVHRAKKGGKK